MQFRTGENRKGDELKTAHIDPSSDQYNQFYTHGKALLGKVEKVFSNNKIEMPGKICSIMLVYPPEGEVFMEVTFMPPRNLILNNGVKPVTRYVKKIKPTVMWTIEKSEAMLLTEKEVKTVMAVAAHQWNDPQVEVVETEKLMEEDDDAASDN